MSDTHRPLRIEIAAALNQWKKDRWNVDQAVERIEALIDAKVREILQEKSEALAAVAITVAAEESAGSVSSCSARPG